MKKQESPGFSRGEQVNRTLPDGTTITYTSADRARRMDEARRSLKAAMVTISHAQTAALAVAATPYRVEAVNHAAEHAMAAIRGMDKALRADWMEAR